ncbi:MAG: site-specific integrase [Granulosicoccus sp.]
MDTSPSTDSVSQNPIAEIRAELELAKAEAQNLAQESLAVNTRRLFVSDWQGFLAWVHRAQQANNSLSALPATDEMLALYVGREIGTSPSTLARRLSAIRLMHRWAGFDSPFDSAPSITAVYAGFKRRWANRQPTTTPQAAATESIIRTLADAWTGQSLLDMRNYALLLVGFDSALRRSELVGVDVEHLASHPKGLEIHVPVSKTDQTGEGTEAYLLARPDTPYCPVAALANWIDAAGIESGAAFRRLHRCGSEHRLGKERLSDKAVYRLVKETAALCGVPGRFGAHSLRRGLITSALKNKHELAAVRDHARHKNISTTSRYSEHVKGFDAHPGKLLLKP